MALSNVICPLRSGQTGRHHAPTITMSVEKQKNVMRDVRIGKLCLNICVGESGDKLTRAAKVGGRGEWEGWCNLTAHQ